MYRVVVLIFFLGIAAKSQAPDWKTEFKKHYHYFGYTSVMCKGTEDDKTDCKIVKGKTVTDVVKEADDIRKENCSGDSIESGSDDN